MKGYVPLTPRTQLSWRSVGRALKQSQVRPVGQSRYPVCYPQLCPNQPWISVTQTSTKSHSGDRNLSFQDPFFRFCTFIQGNPGATTSSERCLQIYTPWNYHGYVDGMAPWMAPSMTSFLCKPVVFTSICAIPPGRGAEGNLWRPPRSTGKVHINVNLCIIIYRRRRRRRT